MVRMIDTRELLTPFAGAELVPLPELRHRLGITMGQQRYMVGHGVLRPVEHRPGPRGGYRIRFADAALLVLATLVAHGAGVPVVTILRAMNESGIPAERWVPVVTGDQERDAA